MILNSLHLLSDTISFIFSSGLLKHPLILLGAVKGTSLYMCTDWHRGGEGGTLIYSYIRRLRSFFSLVGGGGQIVNFSIFFFGGGGGWGGQKN